MSSKEGVKNAMGDLYGKMTRQQKELDAIREHLYNSFKKYDESSSDYDSSHEQKDKKDHCNCHMHHKGLTQGHNPCFDHKHGHHHDHGNCSHCGHHHGHGNCSRCGHHHDKCSCSHKGHNVCNDFFFVDHCCGPKAFSHNHCCDDRFHLHLAGLTGNLNFHLFRKQGCCAKVEFECSSETQTVVGRVCDIGTDFLDILKDDKTILTIMKEKICSIHWLDKCDCSGHFKPCEEDGQVSPEVPETETLEPSE